jgi:short-subunit dehydrogenase
MRIEGQKVLITGASSGIGLALAAALAWKGAVLALTARRIDSLSEAAKGITSSFPNIPAPLTISCDVVDSESVSNLINQSVHHLGGIDILINNAGISVYGNTEMTSLVDFRSVMDVNYFGALHCMLEAIPHMKRAGKGLIVNIASIAAKYGVPYLGAYCASKAALVSLSQSLGAELSRDGISVMNVFPNYTQTGIFENEKKVGGARRPQCPYTSASKVAESIIRAIERERRNLILSSKGNILAIFQGLVPSLIDKAMERIAFQLRDPQEM